MKLQRATRIDETKSSGARIGLDEIGAGEHRAGVRVRIVAVVQLPMNIGKQRRHVRLARTEIELQLPGEQLRMFYYGAVQIPRPRLIDQADPGMRKIRAPHLVLEDAQHFRIFNIGSVLFPHLVNMRQHSLVYFRRILNLGDVEAGRKHGVEFMILAHGRQPGSISDSISDRFFRTIMFQSASHRRQRY